MRPVKFVSNTNPARQPNPVGSWNKVHKYNPSTSLPHKFTSASSSQPNSGALGPMLVLTPGCSHQRLTFPPGPKRSCFRVYASGGNGNGNGFPSFLPQDVDNIKDIFARNLALRIERLPVQVPSSKTTIMSSCVRPVTQGKTDPVVLLHGFDSSVLEWRYMYPLLEDAGIDAWAIDILGWGFSDLESRPSCDVASKRNHLYQLWKSYIKKPMILVGPSLGAAVAIDFAANHPEAVSKLVLIDASVYAEGAGEVSKLPRPLAYAGVALLKSVPLRYYVINLAFKNLSFDCSVDWMKIGRLHCLYPWWEYATVNFMMNGGYNVIPLIKQVKQRTLIIWGEDDQIISYRLALRLHGELQDATLRALPECGHLPHVERPRSVADFIIEFARETTTQLSAV